MAHNSSTCLPHPWGSTRVAPAILCPRMRALIPLRLVRPEPSDHPVGWPGTVAPIRVFREYFVFAPSCIPLLWERILSTICYAYGTMKREGSGHPKGQGQLLRSGSVYFPPFVTHTEKTNVCKGRMRRDLKRNRVLGLRSRATRRGGPKVQA